MEPLQPAVMPLTSVPFRHPYLPPLVLIEAVAYAGLVRLRVPGTVAGAALLIALLGGAWLLVRPLRGLHVVLDDNVGIRIVGTPVAQIAIWEKLERTTSWLWGACLSVVETEEEAPRPGLRLYGRHWRLPLSLVGGDNMRIFGLIWGVRFMSTRDIWRCRVARTIPPACYALAIAMLLWTLLSV